MATLLLSNFRQTSQRSPPNGSKRLQTVRQTVANRCKPFRTVSTDLNEELLKKIILLIGKVCKFLKSLFLFELCSQLCSAKFGRFKPPFSSPQPDALDFRWRTFFCYKNNHNSSESSKVFVCDHSNKLRTLFGGSEISEY